MALITIATAPKAFTNPHIAIIQRNAIHSWLSLGPEVEVVLVGDEPGMSEAAREIGVPQIKEVGRNALGTPLVSSIFEVMRQVSHSQVLVYINADILLMTDFVLAVRYLHNYAGNFLAVGQRWDLEVSAPLDFNFGWETRLRHEVLARGSLHAPVGSDYFAFPTHLFTSIPNFAIGRAGWDNWMIYESRQKGWQVVDLTRAAIVVHQNHDYSHLPGGQPHYHLPETAENTRMAGGRRSIFTLQDADYWLEEGQLFHKRLKGAKFWRELEILPLVKFHSRPMGELFFLIFHPRKAWGEWRGRFSFLIKKIFRRV